MESCFYHVMEVQIKNIQQKYDFVIYLLMKSYFCYIKGVENKVKNKNTILLKHYNKIIFSLFIRGVKKIITKI